MINGGNDNPVIFHLQNVTKDRSAESASFRLDISDLKIVRGEKIALIGESGCGKSTLLDMLTFISKPSAMEKFSFTPGYRNKAVDIVADWQNKKVNSLAMLRKHHMGYVMQTGGLLPYLTVRDNINLSRVVLGMPEDGTIELLARRLRVYRHFQKLPEMLSIGERQRVAIARALAHKPDIIVADEPTASLDPFAAKAIMSLFIELVEDYGSTLIVASHAWQHLRRLGLHRYSFRINRTANFTESTVITR